MAHDRTFASTTVGTCFTDCSQPIHSISGLIDQTEIANPAALAKPAGIVVRKVASC